MNATCAVTENDANKTVIKISGKVDSTNAKQVEESVNSMINDQVEKALVFDFAELDYISSAGLRILLRIQKKRSRRITITDVNPQIADIFDLTGFSEIFNIQKALRKCSIKGCEKLGGGMNGEIVRLDDDTIIKAFDPGIQMDSIKREQQMAHKLFLIGFPTVISYDTVKVDDNRYGNVYEITDAIPLDQYISEYPDRFTELTHKFADLYKNVHSISGSDLGLPRTKDLYLKDIAKSGQWYTDAELEKLQQLVESIPDRDTLVHGNIRQNTILVEGDELIMIDLSGVSIGHPIFDLLSTSSVLVNVAERNPSLTEKETGLPFAKFRRSWDILIDSYFDKYSDEERYRFNQNIKLLSKLKEAVLPVTTKGMPGNVCQSFVQDVKRNLIPQIDDLIDSVEW